MFDPDVGRRVRSGLWRSRWAAFGAAVAVGLGGGGLFIATAASTAPSSFVAIDPVRVLDSRDPANVGVAGPFVSATGLDLLVTGSIPTTTGTQVVVPPWATAVSLNVTAVSPTANGFVSVRPADSTGPPAVSSINVVAGGIVPNAVIVQLPATGPDAGKIEIAFNAYGTLGPSTDILVDVNGYFVAAPSGPSVYWGKVDADTTGATLLNGAGITAVGRISAGVYFVTFASSVANCGWTATLNDNADGVTSPGEIGIELGSLLDPFTLWIRTSVSSGALADRSASDGFTVTALCN